MEQVKRDTTFGKAVIKSAKPYSNAEIRELQKNLTKIPHCVFNLNQLRMENEKLRQALKGIM